MTTGAISRAKLQSNRHRQQTNTQHFTGRMPFLSPNQQCQSTEWKSITLHGLLNPSSSGDLPPFSLTTKGSWLQLGRVALPLIGPLMPVPQCSIMYTERSKHQNKKWHKQWHVAGNNTMHKCILCALRTDQDQLGVKSEHFHNFNL